MSLPNWSDRSLDQLVECEYGTTAISSRPAATGPLLRPFFAWLLEGRLEKTALLAGHNRATDSYLKISFLDVGSVFSAGGRDGIQVATENDLAFGKTLVGLVATIFADRYLRIAPFRKV
jgi:hypothetical protein